DPLGLISPLFVPIERLFQDLYKYKYKLAGTTLDEEVSLSVTRSLVLSRLITRVRSALLPLVKITEIFLLDRFHYDYSLDKGGGQRIQAIR
ncbi:hypothetical protein pdam_00006897, partial [Pocillopora damicornis]